MVEMSVQIVQYRLHSYICNAISGKDCFTVACKESGMDEHIAKILSQNEIVIKLLLRGEYFSCLRLLCNDKSCYYNILF